jgi:hypothetical protein
MKAFPMTGSEAIRSSIEAQPPVFSPSEAQRFYSPLGAWKGPLASTDVQGEALAFWRASGEAGIRWLVRRLKDEHDLDSLHGAASLLAELGQVIIDPVFQQLAAGASGDQALCLLWALDSLCESDPGVRVEGAQPELVLADLLRNDDPDVRDVAASAMRLVRRE